MSSTVVWCLVMFWCCLAYPIVVMPVNVLNLSIFLFVVSLIIALAWDLRHWEA